MHNPNVSDQAKEHSRQVVEEIQRSGAVRDDGNTESSSRLYAGSKNENRVLGGFRVTLKSSFFLFNWGSRRANPLSLLALFIDPNINDEAKQRAEQILKDKEAL
jgi:hypothetical protein